MSKRKTPAQALEEFLSYYDESILEYRYACDKVVEEDKRLQDFLHEMEFAKDRVCSNTYLVIWLSFYFLC